MRSVKLEGAIKPINTLLWLQAVRTIHILINGRRIDVGSPGAFDIFSPRFFALATYRRRRRQRGSSRMKRQQHKKKNCLFINNADKKNDGAMLNCRHTDRENRIGFHASDSKPAHPYLSFVRWLIFRFFVARARKRKILRTENWKILLYGETWKKRTKYVSMTHL